MSNDWDPLHAPPLILDESRFLEGDLLSSIVGHGERAARRAAVGRGVAGLRYSSGLGESGRPGGPLKVTVVPGPAGETLLYVDFETHETLHGLTGAGEVVEFKPPPAPAIPRSNGQGWPLRADPSGATQRFVLGLNADDRLPTGDRLQLFASPPSPKEFWRYVPIDVLEFQRDTRTWKELGWAPRQFEYNSVMDSPELDADLADGLAAAADTLFHYAARFPHLPLWTMARELSHLGYLLLEQAELSAYCPHLLLLRDVVPLCGMHFAPMVVEAMKLRLTDPVFSYPAREFVGLASMFRSVIVSALASVYQVAQNLSRILSEGYRMWRVEPDLYLGAHLGAKIPIPENGSRIAREFTLESTVSSERSQSQVYTAPGPMILRAGVRVKRRPRVGTRAVLLFCFARTSEERNHSTEIAVEQFVPELPEQPEPEYFTVERSRPEWKVHALPVDLIEAGPSAEIRVSATAENEQPEPIEGVVLLKSGLADFEAD